MKIPERDNCDMSVLFAPFENKVLECDRVCRSSNDEIAELRPIEFDIFIFERPQSVDEVMCDSDRARIGLEISDSEMNVKEATLKQAEEECRTASSAFG